MKKKAKKHRLIKPGSILDEAVQLEDHTERIRAYADVLHALASSQEGSRLAGSLSQIGDDLVEAVQEIECWRCGLVRRQVRRDARQD